mmetsp:Transcript_15793/g.20611  ORF Transcript_15793/g.20611 Transcript_15793/m.20611 type:complete len:81 (+) Transcript_15793:533-775(+)
MEYSFFETSALTGQNVEKMFTALATTIKHKRIDEFEGGDAAGGIQGAPSVDNASTVDNRTVNLSAAGGDAPVNTTKSGCC